ncbi:MAG TPA: S9 family peptidase, partial [Chitinophagaceae bacterium]|nr:S9 family peptidase [Chitinophagaceae bacterium]
MKKNLIAFLLVCNIAGYAQNQLTPELLYKLGRVNTIGLSKDKKNILYIVDVPNIEANAFNRKRYMIPITGGNATEIKNADSLVQNQYMSPDGKYIISSKAVKVKNIFGSDFYPALKKSNVHMYDSLNYRHWDKWEDGVFDHVFVTPFVNGLAGEAKDIMPNEPYDCPQKPFGGKEDFIWNPDSKHILYTTKKKFGTAYTVSTNTDLYEYDIETGKTKNLTEGMMGYDVQPAYNSKGQLAWLSMKRDGFEADKQDIIMWDGNQKINLTAHADNIHVEGFTWSEDGNSIFFWAPTNGTLQLFQIDHSGINPKVPVIKQITNGDFDITGITAQKGNTLVVSRTDMNHAT